MKQETASTGKQNRIRPSRLLLPAEPVHSCGWQKPDTRVHAVPEAGEGRAGGSGESLGREDQGRRPAAPLGSQCPQWGDPPTDLRSGARSSLTFTAQSFHTF